jgi:hypothetical protein
MQAISAQDTMDSQDGDLTVPRAKGRLMADPSDDSDGDDGGRRRSHPHRARSPTSEAHSQASAAQRCREEDDDDVTRRSQQYLTTISHVSLPYLIYISPATCQLKSCLGGPKSVRIQFLSSVPQAKLVAPKTAVVPKNNGCGFRGGKTSVKPQRRPLKPQRRPLKPQRRTLKPQRRPLKPQGMFEGPKSCFWRFQKG